MDYLVFLTGLFLLAASVACVFIFHEDRQISRWPLLAAALLSLCLKIWWGILVFSIGMDDSLSPVRAFLTSAFATALFGFCLSPLAHETKRSIFVFKWAAMVAIFAFTFISGLGNGVTVSYMIPTVTIAFAGGWQIAVFSRINSDRKKMRERFTLAVLLTIVAVVCILPNATEIAYDLNGQGHATARILVLVFLCGAAVASCAFCLFVWSKIYHATRDNLSANLIRRRQIGTTVILAAAVFTAANGAWLAHWLGNQALAAQTSTLLSALRLGGGSLDAERIKQIAGIPTEVAGNNFAELHSKLVEIRKALPRTRFTYLVGLRNNQLVFLVDSENPADTANFSPPGEIVEKHPPGWIQNLGTTSLANQASFQGPYSDEWGVWFTAAVPIFDQDQKVIALLGVDYPARDWLQPLAARRLASMGVTLSVALLLIALFGFHLISIGTARRMENLSDRLSDAMTAAEFDTWEYFPATLRINIGERIASTLGWVGNHVKPTFRKVWKNIHLADRYQLITLLRPSDGENPALSEAEVRIKNADGHWIWFMLRGRIVHTSSGDTRMVGTILNIDESYRSRLEIDKQRRFAQHVMESVPNGLAIIGADGVLSYVNPAFIRLARGTSNSLVGMKLESLIGPKGSIHQPNESGSFEAALTCIDGSEIPVQAFRAPLTESGQHVGSILAIVDLTAAKEAEQDLLRSRAEASRLALVAKRTDNAVVITDAKGRIEWVNEGFTQISGYNKEEVVGKTPGSFLQRGGSAGPTQNYMRERIREAKGFEAEVLNYNKSGRAYLVHIECQPLFDRAGTLTGFMAIERDITRTRRSSNLLEAVASINTTLLSRRIEPDVWGEILEALGSAASVERCYLFQVHDHPTLGTPAMSQTAEWNSGTSSPQIMNAELQNVPFQESGFSRWYRELSAGNEIAGLVSTFPKEEQPLLVSQEILSLVVVPIFTGEKLWGFMGFDACHEDRLWESWEISILRSAAANIGLRQVAQNESDALVLARDEANNAAIAAEKANRAKSTFLATMSHEIRTPLNAVLGMASLLETTSLNTQQQDYAATILNSSNFLLDLINDILDYSRIESGKIDLDSSPFTLANVCRDAFDVIRPGTMGKQIELICRISPHLPKQLRGDRSRIRQVLVNLLSNAVKFTHSGFVSLMVDGNHDSNGNWNLSLEVRDSGIGIAQEAIPRLFQPFVQEDSSTTRRFGGSGLGLAISKRLAELMGGTIRVESFQGKGSTFTATLSLGIANSELPAPIAAPTKSPHSPISILVVDDNLINLRILEETLANWGLSCHTAEHATVAIELWKKNGPYDLIMSDHHMPDMDGVSLVAYLKKLLDASKSHFTLLSSETNHTAEIREIFDEIGSKPIWPTTIQSMLIRQFPGIIAEPSETHRPSSSFEPAVLENINVLVAEDNPNNQKVVRLLLRRLGIEPTIVDNGSQAVEAARTNSFDVMLLDIQMPVMDGLEACRTIRSLNLTKRPFIIALTASAFQEDRDAASAAGMDSYLAKPITLARLRETFTAMANPTAAID